MMRRLKSALSVAAVWTAIATLGSLTPSVPAEAQPMVSLYDKWQISASGTAAILNTTIRIDSEQLGVGTELDVEDDLGLEETVIQPRAAFRWRPGRRHELEGGFQFAERNAENQIQRTITIADTTFDAGANLDITFNTNQAFLAYRYSIFAKERSQFGVGIGTGTIFLGVGLDALASAGSSQVDYSAEGSIIAPFGSLGVYGRMLSGERWQFEGDARILKAGIDRFDIQVLDFNVAARYFTSQKFGLEAGWGVSSIEVDIGPKESGAGKFFSGRLEYSLMNVRLGVVFVP